MDDSIFTLSSLSLARWLLSKRRIVGFMCVLVCAFRVSMRARLLTESEYNKYSNNNGDDVDVTIAGIMNGPREWDKT